MNGFVRRRSVYSGHVLLRRIICLCDLRVLCVRFFLVFYPDRVCEIPNSASRSKYFCHFFS
jgi:hypothetical protein